MSDGEYLRDLFGLHHQVAIVTGATGVLGGAMARGLARAGARVGILGRREERATAAVRDIEAAGGEAMVLLGDVLNEADLTNAREAVLQRWGRIDILLNCAGGGWGGSSVPLDGTVFDIPFDAFRGVIDLNLLGTILPTMIFGPAIVGSDEKKTGCVVNISSVAAQRPLSRHVGYAAAKAAVENFTRWMAVEMVTKFGERIRVNCIAPGFYLADQNRDLLVDADGTPTKRGRDVLNHTPVGRFGNPEELVSALIWLCSPGASFVTGVVVTVDGGFSAFNGV